MGNWSKSWTHIERAIKNYFLHAKIIAYLGKKLSNNYINQIEPKLELTIKAKKISPSILLRLNSKMLLLKKDELIKIEISHIRMSAELEAWARMKGHSLFTKSIESEKIKYLFQKMGTEYALDYKDMIEESSHLQDGWMMDEPSLPRAPKYFGLMPRGCDVENSTPLYEFELDGKELIWAHNVSKLYEEAKQNQWNASDIKWDQIPDLPIEKERAICQVMTYLAENEFSALYIPGKFISKISPYYMELTLFLATLINDEARHIEAFTKRAMAKGVGLLNSSTVTQRSLYSLFVEKDYFKTSFLLHILGEGTFLDLLEFLAKHAPDEITREVVLLAKKDEQRHVNYGLAHVKALISANPKRVAYLREAAFKRKAYLDEMSGESELLIEALCIIAGGSDEKNFEEGYKKVVKLKEKMGENRVKRMIQCGIDEQSAIEISGIHTPNFM